MVTAEHIVSPGRPVLVLYDGKAATGTPLVSAAVAKPHLTAQQGSTPGDTLLAQSVTTALASMRFLDLEPDSIREPSWPGQAILGDRGERLASVVQKLCADPTSERVLMSWVQALTPMDVTAIDIKSDLGGRLLVYLRDSGGHEISAWSASDGTLRFLGLAAALLSAEPGTLFFLEEIDTGIHPTRLHLLVQLIEQACSQRGVQVIATTHNAGMLSLLRSDARDAALLVYRADGAPDSQVRRLMELPDIARVLEKHDIARLHASGWLEQAAAYAESLARGEEP